MPENPKLKTPKIIFTGDKSGYLAKATRQGEIKVSKLFEDAPSNIKGTVYYHELGHIRLGHLDIDRRNFNFKQILELERQADLFAHQAGADISGALEYTLKNNFSPHGQESLKRRLQFLKDANNSSALVKRSNNTITRRSSNAIVKSQTNDIFGSISKFPKTLKTFSKRKNALFIGAVAGGVLAAGTLIGSLISSEDVDVSPKPKDIKRVKNFGGEQNDLQKQKAWEQFLSSKSSNGSIFSAGKNGNILQPDLEYEIFADDKISAEEYKEYLKKIKGSQETNSLMQTIKAEDARTTVDDMIWWRNPRNVMEINTEMVEKNNLGAGGSYTPSTNTLRLNALLNPNTFINTLTPMHENLKRLRRPEGEKYAGISLTESLWTKTFMGMVSPNKAQETALHEGLHAVWDIDIEKKDKETFYNEALRQLSLPLNEINRKTDIFNIATKSPLYMKMAKNAIYTIRQGDKEDNPYVEWMANEMFAHRGARNVFNTEYFLPENEKLDEITKSYIRWSDDNRAKAAIKSSVLTPVLGNYGEVFDAEITAKERRKAKGSQAAMMASDFAVQFSDEGLHPNSEGLGTQILRAHSDFGSSAIIKAGVGKVSGLIAKSKKRLPGMPPIPIVYSHPKLPTKGLSVSEIIETADKSIEMSVGNFAKMMGVKTRSLGKISDMTERAYQRKAMLDEGLEFGESYVDVKYILKNLEDGYTKKKKRNILKGVIFHEAMESRNAFGIVNKYGVESLDNVVSNMGHKMSIAQEELFLRKLGDRGAYKALSELRSFTDTDYSGFSAKDDAWNTIEGLRHGGLAENVRKMLTDFGSGWKGSPRISETNQNRLEPFNLNNGQKFSGMPNSGTMAASKREQLTEFKADFASRWDPMIKLAAKLFNNSDDAMDILKNLPEFENAINLSLKKSGKLLGVGKTARTYSHKAVMEYQGKKYDFEFVSKKVRTVDDLKAGTKEIPGMPKNLAVRMNKMTVEDFVPREAKALSKLEGIEENLSPSYYGTYNDSIIMEKFDVVGDLTKVDLNEKDFSDLNIFMARAHDIKISHTDLHAENILKVKTPDGKEQIAVIDWGLASRLHGKTPQAFKEKVNLVGDVSEELLGKRISMENYSNLSDLKRISAHKEKITDKSHHLGINALMFSGEIPTSKKAIENVLMSNLSNSISKRAIKKQNANVIGEATEVISPKRAIKKQNTAFAATVSHNTDKTVLAQRDRTVLAEKERTVPHLSDKTVNIQDDRTQIQQAVKRNKRFNKISEEAVGIGHRAAHNASRGHRNFSTTNSY